MTGPGENSRPPASDAFAARRFGVAAAAGVLAIAVVVLVLVLALGSGGTSGPASLVPADALAYVQVDTDPESSASQSARRIARALPMLSAQLVERLGSGLAAIRQAGVGAPGKRPGWLGDQVAVAALPGSYPLQEVQLLAVANEDGAKAFAARLTGAKKPGSYRGFDLWSGRRGTVAIADGFLLSGPAKQVKLMVDTSIGDGEALSGSNDYDAATQGLPTGGLAQGYISANGSAALLGDSLSFLDPLVAGSGLHGLGFALSPTDSAVELTARSAFDPADHGAPPLAGLDTFEAKLPQSLPAKSLAYAGVGTAGAALRGSLTGLAGVGSAISTAFSALVPGRGSSALRGLSAAFGSETAIVVQSRTGSSATGVAPPGAGLVSTGVDPERAKAALRRKATKGLVGRVSGNTMRVAGDRRELTALTRPKGSLDTTAGFSNAMVGFSTSPTLQTYLDVQSLVPLFEAAGLAENPAYASFAGEIRRLRALGLVVSSEKDSITVQARLTVATAGAASAGSD